MSTIRRILHPTKKIEIPSFGNGRLFLKMSSKTPPHQTPSEDPREEQENFKIVIV